MGTDKPEIGFKAKCWFCDQPFTKTEENWCSKCHFHKCPACGKCACDLTEFERKIVRYTLEACLSRDT